MSLSILIIPGIIGAIYCAFDKSYTANLIWMFSNIIMAVRAYYMNDMSLVLSFVVYQLVAMLGVFRHLKEQRKLKNKNSVDL